MGGLFLQHPCTQNMLEVPPFEQCRLSFPAQQNTLGLRATCAERKLREADFMGSWWVSFQLLWQNTDQNQLIGGRASLWDVRTGTHGRNLDQKQWRSMAHWLTLWLAQGLGLNQLSYTVLAGPPPPWKLHWLTVDWTLLCQLRCSRKSLTDTFTDQSDKDNFFFRWSQGMPSCQLMGVRIETESESKTPFSPQPTLVPRATGLCLVIHVKFTCNVSANTIDRHPGPILWILHCILAPLQGASNL